VPQRHPAGNPHENGFAPVGMYDCRIHTRLRGGLHDCTTARPRSILQGNPGTPKFAAHLHGGMELLIGKAPQFEQISQPAAGTIIHGAHARIRTIGGTDEFRCRSGPSRRLSTTETTYSCGARFSYGKR
jgi:hypothetical protein